MGNGASIHSVMPDAGPIWINYCRLRWRSLRVKQLDEFLGLKRPALKRGDSQTCLEDIVKRITSEPIPFLTDPDDNSDLTNAIAKLNSGSILHTEKRALERLLAQRYEDALAAAAAASQAEEEVVLGGASEVLRQYLLVFQQNNLPTELDKGPPEPAEWRRRVHAARRRAFLVVRAMVRLKREVKRLGVPLGDLQWLVPVAAAERWGQVKALAAEYHRLEGVLQDAEMAISQLQQMKEAQAQVLAAQQAPPKTAGGRASPQPRALRSSGGRLSTPSGRAISESGSAPGQPRRPRTSLTADPPSLPSISSGTRTRRITGATGTGPAATHPPGVANGASPARVPARRATESQTQVLPSTPGLPLVPTLSPARSPAGGSTPTGNSPFAPPMRRLSLNGGMGGVSSGQGSPLGAAGSLTQPGSASILGNGLAGSAHRAGSGRSSLPEVVVPGSAHGQGLGGNPLASSPGSMQRLGSLAKTSVPGGTQLVRQTFVEGTIPISPPGSTLPPAIRPSSGAVSPTREHSPRATPTHPATPSQPNHPFPSITDMVEVLTAPEGYTNAPAFNGPTANGGPRRPVPGASPDTLNARPGGTRTWGVSVDPLPPSAPPPAPGVRRPLGPLSHGQGAGLSPAAAAAAAVVAAANGGPMPEAPASGANANGAATPAAPAAPMQQLILDGETLDQAMSRFKVAAEDTRGALVDTCRRFRAVLDCANSAWADQRWWLAAHTHEETALDSWPASEEYAVNRADTVRSLKAGAVAFQFMACCEEPLVGPTGNRFDWWTSDPWEVAADLVPDQVSATPKAGSAPPNRLIGQPLGVRVLQQLANAVSEAAGPQAAEALPVILHVSDRQQEAIAADLLQYGIYRRLRRNLYIVVQPSLPAMRWDPAEGAFTPCTPDQAAPGLPGSGYAMLQLLWPGAALFVNERGELERLQHSLMDELRNRGIEWFVSRSCSDLSLLLDDGALDLRTLAAVVAMWSNPGQRYSLALQAASTYSKPRELIAQHGTVLMCRKPKTSGMVMGRLDGAVRVDRYAGGIKPQLPVVELGAWELNSEHMQKEVAELAAARATAMTVGLGRYVFRFEVLSKLLTGPTVLRPKLMATVEAKAAAMAKRVPWGAGGGDASEAGLLPGPPGSGPLSATQLFNSTGLTEHQLAAAAGQGLDTVMLRLHLSMTDLSMHHAIKVVAITAHRPPLHVRSAADGGALVALLRRSDEDLGSAAQRLAARLPSFARHQKPPQSILLFVQDNGVSLTATNVAAGLLRPERGDHVHMVTVVAGEAQRGEGQALLDRFIKAFRGSADVTTHVLAQDGRGLLEVVGDVIATHRCGLVVIGSASLTATAAAAPAARGAAGPPGTASKAPGTSAGSGTTLGGSKGGAMGGLKGAPGTGVGGEGGGAGAGAGGGGGGHGNGVLHGPGDDPHHAELLVSSTALSVLRTFSLPTIVITANTRHYFRRHAPEGATHSRPSPAVRHGGAAGGAGRMGCMVAVERHARPMMHHLARYLLEPTLRSDALTLTQVVPPNMLPGSKDPDINSVQAVALKTLMANYEGIAAANDFHSPGKVLVANDWDKALCSAAREHGAHLLCLQLPPSAGRSLPGQLLSLLRACPCPVMVYPERVIVPGSGLLAVTD